MIQITEKKTGDFNFYLEKEVNPQNGKITTYTALTDFGYFFKYTENT